MPPARVDPNYYIPSYCRECLPALWLERTDMLGCRGTWYWKIPREIQLFPCVTSRATDTSVGSLKSNRPDSWSAEGVQEEPGWQGGPARGSTESDLSQEPTGPAGTASGLGERVGVAPSDHPCEEEKPSAKRQRRMMIRHVSGLT